MVTSLLIIAHAWSLNFLTVQQADLAFGHSQVEAVIRDRPDMGVVINREPELRKMLDWSFGGQFRSNRTYWDPREPEGGRPSENFQVYVRVTKQESTSAVDKCAGLVFELESLQLDNEWETIKNAAVARKINRDAYAVVCVSIEYRALVKTRDYFRNHPLKDMQSENNSLYRGTLGLKLDFSGYLEWLNGLDPSEYNPLHFYGNIYDELVTASSDQVSTPSQRAPTKSEISAEELLKE